MRPLFQLGARLSLCAELARPQKKLCDVGTDHAYLPIWLLKSGQIPSALAVDVNEGPLLTAEQNARRYHVEENITLRLSDGLHNVKADEADDIVIAGMGGELIARMVAETPWLCDESKRLILQPMSGATELRLCLREHNFAILEEHAVEDSGRVYTVMAAEWREHLPAMTERESLLYPYLGALTPDTPQAAEYARRLLRHLNGLLQGALRGRGEDDPEHLTAVIAAITEIFPEN